MRNDIGKYTNWRAITESDYVTMFIKTWFAFIAALRELYPNISVFTEDGMPRGDRPFTNKFKEKMLKIISESIDVMEFSRLLSDINDVSRNKIATVFPQYFFSTFYRVNEDYEYAETSIEYTDETDNKKIKDRVHISLKIQDRFNLSGVIQTNGIYNKNNYNETVKIHIPFKDIIDSLDLNNAPERSEWGYLDAFFKRLNKRIEERVYAWIERNLKEKYSESIKKLVTSKIRYCLTKIIERVNLNLNDIFKNTELPENECLIIKQRPLIFFSSELSKTNVDEVKQKYTVQKLKEDVFHWFIDFVVSLRNALFHEIIDPLDEEWQAIFKNAYLALKTMLDAISDYLIKEEMCRFIESTYIDKENEELFEAIKDAALCEPFSLDEYELVDDEPVIEQIEVEGIDFFDENSVKVDGNEVMFGCRVNLLVDGNAKVVNYDLSPYDKEDDKYYYLAQDNVTFRNARANVSIDVKIGFNARDIEKTAKILEVKTSYFGSINVELSEDASDNEWEEIYPDEEDD